MCVCVCVCVCVYVYVSMYVCTYFTSKFGYKNMGLSGLLCSCRQVSTPAHHSHHSGSCPTKCMPCTLWWSQWLSLDWSHSTTSSLSLPAGLCWIGIPSSGMSTSRPSGESETGPEQNIAGEPSQPWVCGGIAERSIEGLLWSSDSEAPPPRRTSSWNAC